MFALLGRETPKRLMMVMGEINVVRLDMRLEAQATKKESGYERL